MATDVNHVLERLPTLQIESGGYYGIDITKLSKELGVTPRGLRKQIAGWKRSIKEFGNLRYLGKRPPSVTLTEFIEIEARIHSNPIEVKSRVLGDIRDDRLSKSIIHPCVRIREKFRLLELYRHNLHTDILY
jgi:hypothetical protein